MTSVSKTGSLPPTFNAASLPIVPSAIAAPAVAGSNTAAAAASQQKPDFFKRYIDYVGSQRAALWKQYLASSPLARAEVEKCPDFQKRYTVIEPRIAKGHFGRIYLVVDKTIGKHRAMKINLMADDVHFENALDERDMLRALSDKAPNVPRLHDSCAIAPFTEAIVMDYCQGSNLYDRYIKPGSNLGPLTWDNYLLVLMQGHIINDFLRKRGIAHRDIKPDNGILDERTGVYTVCDFGFAKKLGKNKSTDLVCTRPYRAPEVFLGLPHDCSVDTWALASLAVELGTNKIPFPPLGKDGLPQRREQFNRMMRFKGRIPPKEWLDSSALTGLYFEKRKDGRYVPIDCDPMPEKRPEHHNEASLLRFRLRPCWNQKLWPEIDLAADLLRREFRYEGEDRLVPEAAFDHPLFQKWLYAEFVRDNAWTPKESCIVKLFSEESLAKSKEAKPLLKFNLAEFERLHCMRPRAARDRYRVCITAADGKVLLDEAVEIPRMARILLGDGKPVVTPIRPEPFPKEEGKSDGKDDKKKS